MQGDTSPGVGAERNLDDDILFVMAYFKKTELGFKMSYLLYGVVNLIIQSYKYFCLTMAQSGKQKDLNNIQGIYKFSQR